jgi:phosphoribosyl 1,2-cyclic phosphodiesterase
MPFDAVHDTQEPMGLLFQSTLTGEKGIYIVDSGYVEYDFKGVTHYLIECNYAEELLEAGPYDEHLKDRVRRNHYSLENLEVFLSTSDLSQTEEIWLLHLSDANSDEQMFQQEIQALTGVPTYVAN